MGIMDGIKNSFHISNMLDDDLDVEMDEEAEAEDDFDEEEETPRKNFFDLFKKPVNDDIEDETIEEEPVKPSRFNPKKPVMKSEPEFIEPAPKTFNPAKASAKKNMETEPVAPVRQEAPAPKNKANGGKVISMNKVSGSSAAGVKNMNELYMIKPKKEEDARAAVDALLARKIVIINLEGLNLDIAQYVTDFVTGANYSIGGNFSTINSQVLVFTPAGVDLTGAFEDAGYDNGRDY